MSDPTLVRSYSEALFQSAKSTGRLEVIAPQAQQLAKLVREDQRLNTFLNAPNIPRDVKESVFGKIFESKVDPLLMNFLRLLVRRGRLELMDEALEAFFRRFERHQGFAPARVVTAIELREQERADLQKALENFTKLKLRIDWRVEPRVLGGVRFQVDDTLIDTTLASGLGRLRHEFEQARVY